jgi:hypothetical protein
VSDCPDCENEGWTWEWIESPEDELRGYSYRLPCRNWRHSKQSPAGSRSPAGAIAVTGHGGGHRHGGGQPQRTLAGKVPMKVKGVSL